MIRYQFLNMLLGMAMLLQAKVHNWESSLGPVHVCVIALGGARAGILL
jgi:hypothetical protein